MKKLFTLRYSVLLLCTFFIVDCYSQLTSTITMWKQEGVNPVFNRSTNTVTYTKPDANGTYHIFTSDSLGQNEKQLSYAGWGNNLHQFVEEIDPTGQYFVCYVEKPDTNKWEWFYTFHTRTHEDATPGYGWYTDIWVLKSDGSQAWKLTNLTNDYTTGVLHGAMSPDGSVFGWTERVTATNVLDPFNLPFGETLFRVADLVLTPTPHFENIHTFIPNNVAASCGELESISADKKTLAFYSTFETKNIFTTPIYTMDTVTKVPRKLSSGVASQDPTFTPDGQHIIYASANGCDKFANSSTLGFDWYITNLDSSITERITKMNVTNDPQSDNNYRLAGTLTFMSNNSFLGGVLTNAAGAVGSIVKVSFDNLTTGVEPLATKPDCYVYPNPVKDNIHLKVFSQNQAALEITLVNYLGQVIFTETQTLYNGENNFDFDLSSYHLPAGAYLLRTSSKGGMTRNTIIKQ